MKKPYGCPAKQRSHSLKFRTMIQLARYITYKFLLPCDGCKSQTFLWDFETTTVHYMLRGSPTIFKKIIGKSMIF
jgi:hypothetical protein